MRVISGALNFKDNLKKCTKEIIMPIDANDTKTVNRKKNDLDAANTLSGEATQAASRNKSNNDKMGTGINEPKISQQEQEQEKGQEDAMRSVANNYDKDEKAHLMATMGMFAKKHLLTPISFNWLKASMSVIGEVFNVIKAIFDKGLLNLFNLGSIMELPLLKGISSLFNVIGKKEDSLEQDGFDEAINTVKSVAGGLVNSINSDDISTNVIEAGLRAVTSTIDTNEVSGELINTFKNSDLAKKSAEMMSELGEQGVEFVATKAKDWLKVDENKEVIKEVLKENLDVLTTPEMKAMATEVAVDAIKTTINGGLESVVTKGASYLSSAANGVSSFVGGFFHTSSPADNVETDVKPTFEEQTPKMAL